MAKQIVDVLEGIPESGAKVTVPVEHVGSIVNEYLDALKAAAKMEELKKGLVLLGLDAVVRHNCVVPPEKYVKSARLAGRAVDGEVPEVLATTVDKDPKLDAELVNRTFASAVTVEGKVANPNNYTRYQVVAEFDPACFHDEKGNIDPERVEEILTAYEATAKRLGIPNPVSISKQLAPTKTWWDERFSRFGPAALTKLFKAIPQQVQIRLPKEEK